MDGGWVGARGDAVPCDGCAAVARGARGRGVLREAPMRPARKTVIIDEVERLLAEVLREHGVSFSVFSQRVANGWPIGDAATIAAGAMRRSRPGPRPRARLKRDKTQNLRTIIIDGIVRPTPKVCREHGISRQLFAQRIATGWDAARAATTPPRTSMPRTIAIDGAANTPPRHMAPRTIAIDGAERPFAEVLREHDVA